MKKHLDRNLLPPLITYTTDSDASAPGFSFYLLTSHHIYYYSPQASSTHNLYFILVKALVAFLLCDLVLSKSTKLFLKTRKIDLAN
jgi:hypothetical protein